MDKDLPTLLDTAAVLNHGKKHGFLYTKALSHARSEIPLADLGIKDALVRRVAIGGLLVKVHGPGGDEKADALVERLTSVLPEA